MLANERITIANKKVRWTQEESRLLALTEATAMGEGMNLFLSEQGFLRQSRKSVRMLGTEQLCKMPSFVFIMPNRIKKILLNRITPRPQLRAAPVYHVSTKMVSERPLMTRNRIRPRSPESMNI